MVRWGRFKPEHDEALAAFAANCGETALRRPVNGIGNLDRFLDLCAKMLGQFMLSRLCILPIVLNKQPWLPHVGKSALPAPLPLRVSSAIALCYGSDCWLYDAPLLLLHALSAKSGCIMVCVKLA